MSLPSLEVNEYPDLDIGTLGTSVISQDNKEDICPPAANTQQQCQIRTLTQDYMLHMMEIPDYEAPFTPRPSASWTFPLQFLCDFAHAVLDEDTGNLLEYRHLIKHPKYKETWSNSFRQEIRQIMTTTETVFFINKNRHSTRPQRQHHLQKNCMHLQRRKEGQVPHSNHDGRQPHQLPQQQQNSICRPPNSQATPQKYHIHTQHNHVHWHQRLLFVHTNDMIWVLPNEAGTVPWGHKIEKYNLHNKVDTTGNVHCKVRCGMYGLPQAGIIMQKLLEKWLLKAGYRQSKVTPGYWKHDWQPSSFSLVVDDFGVKYINKAEVNHLIQTLKQDYKIEADWEGNRYLGITLDWNYKKCKVHLSMPE